MVKMKPVIILLKELAVDMRRWDGGAGDLWRGAGALDKPGSTAGGKTIGGMEKKTAGEP